MDLLKPKKNSWLRFFAAIVTIPGTWLVIGWWMMHHDPKLMSTLDNIVFGVIYLGAFLGEVLFFTWWNDIDLGKKPRP